LHKSTAKYRPKVIPDDVIRIEAAGYEWTYTVNGSLSGDRVEAICFRPAG
jgi:hypothetical protein